MSSLAAHASFAQLSSSRVAFVLACISLTPGAALADCRPASPSEQEALRRAPPGRSLPEHDGRWVRLGGGVGLGFCDDHEVCIAVGAVVCDTGVFGPVSFARASFTRVGSSRLLVLRWTVEHGGTFVFDGGGIEIWTTEAEPRRLLAVLEDLEVLDNGFDVVEPRDVCSLDRRVVIGARRIRLGARSARGECEGWASHDRIAERPLGPEGASWTWTELAALHARGGAPSR